MKPRILGHKKWFIISFLPFIMPIFFSPSVYAQWTSVGPPLVSTYWRLHGVYFTSPSNGWAVGWDGTNSRGVLLHYSGDTWTSVPPPFVSSSWELDSVHFTSPGEGWAVGWDGANSGGVLVRYSGGYMDLCTSPFCEHVLAPR